MIKSSGKIVILNNIPFTIEEKKVLRAIRMPKVNTLKEIQEDHMAKAIKNAINIAYSLIKGKACYCTIKIMKITGDRVIIAESDRLFNGSNMVRLLKNCDYATLMVCTIGRDIAEKVEGLKKVSLTDAYYLDRIGAWMADYMAEHVGRIIETDIIKNGYEPTFRYAAGYGDWELSAQAEIMRLTQAERIGVSVIETYIMIPRFSVSAVIGWERKQNSNIKNKNAK